jgi:hypothetical protein
MRREIDGYRFIGYYGVIYIFFMILMVITWPITQAYIKPIASLVFPIAAHNSLFKSLLVDTGMFWGMVLFYTLVIQKIRLKF